MLSPTWIKLSRPSYKRAKTKGHRQPHLNHRSKAEAHISPIFVVRERGSITPRAQAYLHGRLATELNLGCALLLYRNLHQLCFLSYYMPGIVVEPYVELLKSDF